jgi:myo-inositol-1(or 4)-monophosphatase
MVNETNELLSLTKDIAKSALQVLAKISRSDDNKVSYDSMIPREMKATVDTIIEDMIIKRLLPTGLSILSEESGELKGTSKSSLQFVVDPLDGTVNFVRSLGPSSISIALCENDQPIFGVLAIYPSGDIAWGGRGKGAFLNDRPINVSKIIDPLHAVLCTGFPSRYCFDNHNSVAKDIMMMSSFGKVRMLGAASISLLQIAKGTAEVYFEKEIMLWDIAAGLAIVKGAGGEFDIKFGKDEHLLSVVASNGLIKW